MEGVLIPLLLGVAGLELVVIVVLTVLLARRGGDPDLRRGLAELTEMLHRRELERVAIQERLQDLTPLSQNVSTLHAQLAQLQAQFGEQLQGLRPMVQSVHQMHNEIARLQTQLGERERLARETREAVQRLERVLVGSYTRGAAGERVLASALSQLPAEWQVRNYRVRNGVVEFGLRLPNGLVLPIDSKWPAADLIERLEACDSAEERLRIKAEIEREVRRRASEVSKYVDPNLTVDFALAVVPDPVYELSADARGEIYAQRVVLISYSLFLPYLLLVFQTALNSAVEIDMQRLQHYLGDCQQIVTGLQQELEGRFARALTMLGNTRDELAAGLGSVQGKLASLCSQGRPVDGPTS